MLGDELKRRQPDFMISLPTAAAGVARALASNKPGLLAVTDPGDNPYSGGINDTPEMFRALVAAKPNRPVVFAAFTDPEVVDKAWRAGVGQNLGTITLGGKAMKDYGAPVAIEATVAKLTEGVFRNIGPMETGIELRCGRTALLTVRQHQHHRHRVRGAGERSGVLSPARHRHRERAVAVREGKEPFSRGIRYNLHRDHRHRRAGSGLPRHDHAAVHSGAEGANSEGLIGWRRGSEPATPPLFAARLPDRIRSLRSRLFQIGADPDFTRMAIDRFKTCAASA